jgi:hypothetical protein
MNSVLQEAYELNALYVKEEQERTTSDEVVKELSSLEKIYEDFRTYYQERLPRCSRMLVLLWCCDLHPDPHTGIFLNRIRILAHNFFSLYFFRLQVMVLNREGYLGF